LGGAASFEVYFGGGFGLLFDFHRGETSFSSWSCFTSHHIQKSHLPMKNRPMGGETGEATIHRNLLCVRKMIKLPLSFRFPFK